MFTQRLILAIAASLTALSLAAPASSAVLFSNGTAVGDSGRCAEDSGACNGTWTVFDDFTLGTDSTVTSISWTARLYGGLSDFNGARAWIYSADPVFGTGMLLASVTTQGASPTASILGNHFYDLTLNTSINLMAGTYWVGFQHDTTSDFGTVAASGTGTGATATQWQNDGAGFRIGNQPHLSFRIGGQAQLTNVPEPGSAALVGLALSALVWSRKRSAVRGNTRA